LDDAGVYQVLVTDAISSDLSDPAVLTVLINPVIAEHPRSQILAEGDTLELTVGVTNTATLPIGYRWRRNGGNLFPENPSPLLYERTNTVVIPNVTADNVGTYTVVVTNQAFFAPGYITANAYVTVVTPPTNTVAAEGSDVTLRAIATVSTTAATTLRTKYQWQFGGADVPGANTNSLTITNFTAAKAGAYTLVMTHFLTTATNVNIASNAFTALVSLPLPDADGDGMPDDWELLYGFNPAVPDANADADNDGLSNGKEYTAGTDPKNAASYLKVDRISWSGGAAIEFQAVSNRTYSVLYRDAVDTGDWLKLSDVSAQATTRTVVVNDPATGPSRYYRLVTPKQ
jgi:hypothetical protein